MGFGKLCTFSFVNLGTQFVLSNSPIAVTAELCKSFVPVICICCCLLICLFYFVYIKRKKALHIYAFLQQGAECIANVHFLKPISCFSYSNALDCDPVCHICYMFMTSCLVSYPFTQLGVEVVSSTWLPELPKSPVIGLVTVLFVFNILMKS